jgi:hypothetical protein
MTRRAKILRIPDPLPAAITRPRDHVQAVLTQSRAETGADGRAALAWTWALTGSRPSPITLSPAPGRPPTREEIRAESQAEPQTSPAPPGVPANYHDQLGEARGILAWLIGASDEIPLDDEQRGRFIGARDDYARTDHDIRTVLNDAQRSLSRFDLPDQIDPADAAIPWRWDASWMNAAWHRGVRDLLSWVLGDSPISPLARRPVRWPDTYELTYEETAASDVIAQGRPGMLPPDPRRYSPPQYGEAILATITWLRGETTTPPAGQNGEVPYDPGI